MRGLKIQIGSHGDVKYCIGKGVAKELTRLTCGHEQGWGDCLRKWGLLGGGMGEQRQKIKTTVIA